MSGLTVTSTRDFRYQTRCAMKKTVQQKKDREFDLVHEKG